MLRRRSQRPRQRRPADSKEDRWRGFDIGEVRSGVQARQLQMAQGGIARGCRRLARARGTGHRSDRRIEGAVDELNEILGLWRTARKVRIHGYSHQPRKPASCSTALPPTRLFSVASRSFAARASASRSPGMDRVRRDPRCIVRKHSHLSLADVEQALAYAAASVRNEVLVTAEISA